MSGSISELVGVKKHEIYFIEGRGVYFLASSGYQQGESTKFRQMFGGLTFPGKEPRGSSPDTAFRFSDVTIEEFAHCLRIFYHVGFTILRIAYPRASPLLTRRTEDSDEVLYQIASTSQMLCKSWGGDTSMYQVTAFQYPVTPHRKHRLNIELDLQQLPLIWKVFYVDCTLSKMRTSKVEWEI
ncbi:hypothetical protein EDD18DRAFT_1106732 [Armillaria luteobubalina]|uniref:BTB domain-containing protein n=1 Tax=Armillaria luteobubalina TaxID=153913 RepID=A0AA39Q2E7_9AGAR|nr:hypothetical protein EDD18DRAFT_1106732 [Armillaria luteobubalina]